MKKLLVLIVVAVLVLPNAVGISDALRAASPMDLGSVAAAVLGAVRSVLSRILDFFIGEARAACGAGGGTCFRINAPGSWSLTNSWSATSGGASCGAACVPAATDAVVFDANSGVGTVTLDQSRAMAGLTMTGYTGTFATGGFALVVNGAAAMAGTFLPTTSKLYFNGALSMNGLTAFTFATSYIYLGATSTFTPFPSSGQSSSYVVIVNASVTVTQAAGANLGVGCLLQVNGTYAYTSNIYVIGDQCTARGTFLAFGPSGSQSPSGSDDLLFLTTSGYAMNIPGRTDYSVVSFEPSDGSVMTLAGYMKGATLFTRFDAATGAGNCKVVTNNFPMVWTFQFRTHSTAPGSAYCEFQFGSSQVWAQSVLRENPSRSLLNFGSSAWIVNATWTDAGGTDPANTVGTSLVTLSHYFTFTDSFNGGTAPYFYDLTYSCQSGPWTWTLGTSLTVAHTLSLTAGGCGATNTIATANLGVTTANLVIGAGTVLSAGTSTITVSGAVTISGAGSSYAGSSAALVLSGGSAQTLALNSQNVGTLQVTGASVKSFTQSFTTGQLTVTVEGATISFTAGIVWTYQGGSVGVSGGSVITLQSATPGSAWTLSLTSPTQAYGIHVSDSTATQTVNACAAGDQNLGGNVGWSFCQTRGGTPVFAVSCSFNPLLVSWTCTDSSDYTLTPVVNRTLWYYDGAYVGQAAPRSTITFRAVNRSWASSPGNHTITMVPWGVGPFDPYTIPVYESEFLAWVVFFVLLAVVAGAFVSARRNASDRDVYFVPLGSYRGSASEEYPKGWRSYTVTDRDFGRYRDVRRGGLEVLYGIRSATATEQERTGRKYIGEPKTVRERM